MPSLLQETRSGERIITSDISVSNPKAWERARICPETLADKVFSYDFIQLLPNKPCNVSLFFTSDRVIQGLNKTHRGKDKPTNVLSFPLHEVDPNNDQFLLGDIVLASGTIQREARSIDKTFENHCAHMLVHGFLHLLGFDHQKEAERQTMEAEEAKILNALGFWR